MYEQDRPPFSTYTKTHEIQKQYIVDVPPKTPGTKGYEMLREDMHSSKYEIQGKRHMNAFRTQRGSRQDHHRVCIDLRNAALFCSNEANFAETFRKGCSHVMFSACELAHQMACRTNPHQSRRDYV